MRFCLNFWQPSFEADRWPKPSLRQQPRGGGSGGSKTANQSPQRNKKRSLQRILDQARCDLIKLGLSRKQAYQLITEHYDEIEKKHCQNAPREEVTNYLWSWGHCEGRVVV